MSHISQKRWGEVSHEVASLSKEMLDLLARVRESSIKMFILYLLAGNTDQALAEQLFREEIEARGDTEPSAAEIQKAQDARSVLAALNQLWEAANNVAVPAEDRGNIMRRMT